MQVDSKITVQALHVPLSVGGHKCGGKKKKIAIPNLKIDRLCCVMIFGILSVHLSFSSMWVESVIKSTFYR